MKLPSDRNGREKALKILERLKKDYPQFNVNKSRSGDAIYVTLPPERIKTPVAARYAKDEVQLKVVVDLAQRLASSMVRETMDHLLDKLVSKLSDGLVDELVEKMPAQQTIIRETATATAEKFKAEFQADPGVYAPTNFDSGMELVGETGSSETTSGGDDMDAILAALEGKS